MKRKFWFKKRFRIIEGYQYTIKMSIGTKTFMKQYFLLKREFDMDYVHDYSISETTMNFEKVQFWSDSFGLSIPTKHSFDLIK